MENFRVYYKINGQEYSRDFSMEGAINAETKSISASQQILKAHPNVNRKDIEVGDIEDLAVS